MAHKVLSGLTFANVCSFLALTVALGTGTAYAASTIGSNDIKHGSIRSVDIKNGGVKTADIRNNQVTAAKIKPSAVDGSKVLTDSLTTADIAGADVNGAGISIPAGFVPNSRCKQSEASVAGAKAGEVVVFSIKAALQDGVVIYGQRVPSDGHVMFDVCNFSGTTQDAISNLPVRIITFG